MSWGKEEKGRLSLSFRFQHLVFLIDSNVKVLPLPEFRSPLSYLIKMSNWPLESAPNSDRVPGPTHIPPPYGWPLEQQQPNFPNAYSFQWPTASRYVLRGEEKKKRKEK